MVTEGIRSGCRWVSSHAEQVSIDLDAIGDYAESLPRAPRPASSADEPSSDRERYRSAAFWLTLDTINYGSGWFPTLRKAPGRSGYATVYSGLHRHFDQEGPWTADELTEITPPEIADVLDQDPEHELMALFAQSLSDLGERLLDEYDGSFLGPVEAAEGSAVGLVGNLSYWSCFEDSSPYADRIIPFLKRAQIAAADLSRGGVAQFADLRRLTMFADNLVPHVLRLDGILTFEPQLVARIERGELIEHGSPEEVEIRACAVHAVELITEVSPRGQSAAEVDEILWNRGQEPQYKASPRHRSRTTAY